MTGDAALLGQKESKHVPFDEFIDAAVLASESGEWELYFEWLLERGVRVVTRQWLYDNFVW